MVAGALGYFGQSALHLAGFLFGDDAERAAVAAALEDKVAGVDDLTRVELCSWRVALVGAGDVGVVFRSAITFGQGRQVVQAVVPRDIHGWHVAPGTEAEENGGAVRVEEIVVCLLVEQRHLVGQPQIQELMHGVEDVCSPVAEGSHSEVIPRAPFALMVLSGVVMPLGSTEPGVPIHALRQGLCFGQVFDIRVETMPATAIVHVSSDGGDILDDACLLPRLELEVVAFGVALVTYLGGQFGMTACHLHEEFSFEEGTRHGLLQIDVLAVGERHHGNGEVDVVGHGSHHGFEVAGSFLEQLAEVAEALDVGVFLQHFLALLSVEVYVAEGGDFDHPRTEEVVEVLFAAIADADEGNLYLFFLCICGLTGSHEVGSGCGGQRGHTAEGDTSNAGAHGLEEVSAGSHRYI